MKDPINKKVKRFSDMLQQLTGVYNRIIRSIMEYALPAFEKNCPITSKKNWKKYNEDVTG